MTNKGRYSPEQRQEDRSLGQLVERFSKYGWAAEPIKRDLGEDLYVRIYDQGQSSGLSFAAQAKSTTDVSGLEIGKEQIRYRVKVLDLEHWKDTVPPVFIIVWDISKERGYWTSVRDAVTELNRRNPNWRSNRTATVRLRAANSTDDTGLNLLRRRVADICYPTIAGDKVFRLTGEFAFPETSEGKAALAALEKHLMTGKTVEIGGQFIREVKFPDWWKRMYGEQPGEIASLKVSQPPSKEPRPVRIEVLPEQGEAAAIDYVELRRQRRGTEEVLFSNKGQNIPLYFRFLFRRTERNFTVDVEVKGPGSDVGKTRDLFRFIRALALGGRLRMTLLREQQVLESALNPGCIHLPPEKIMEFVERACLIQEKTHQTLRIPPDWSINAEDIRTAEQLADIIRTGRATLRNMVLTLKLDRGGVEAMLRACESGRPVQFNLDSPETQSEILGTTISLGPVSVRVTATLERTVEEIGEAAAKLGSGETLPLRFINAEMFEECSNWTPNKGNSEQLQSDGNIG